MSDYIWIEGDQAHTSGPNGTITRVVMHGTVSPCERGGARKVARYFQSSQAGGLAHYIVDPGETVQACREDIACWHAPPNAGSIGVELCDPQAGAVDRWYDDPHRMMLQRAAVLVADLCHRHRLPIEYLNASALLAGRRGITMHRDVSTAWKQSSHTDPGVGFPMAHFVDLVKQVGAPAPAVVPVEDDMPKLQFLRAGGVPNVLWLSDLLTRRKVRDDTEVQRLIKLGVDPTVHVVSTQDIASIKELTP